jgi:hypothetical protein
MSNKICPTCLQPWPDCVCVIPLKRPSTSEAAAPVARPRPHPVLSRQLMGPLRNPNPLIFRPLADDPPKEFCPDCSQPWPGCKCAGRRI